MTFLLKDISKIRVNKLIIDKEHSNDYVFWKLFLFRLFWMKNVFNKRVEDFHFELSKGAIVAVVGG